MSFYVTVQEMAKLLANVEGWLDKATAFATTKKFDPSVLLQMRIAPDMFPLLRQVQAACDQAKYSAARTAGKDAPAHPDTEQTIDELKKRIQSVVAYLRTFTEQDFEGADARSVTTPRWEGKSLTAPNYLVEHSQPNFFFHLSMTYALLRHAGVEIGKRDYLGALTWR